MDLFIIMYFGFLKRKPNGVVFSQISCDWHCFYNFVGYIETHELLLQISMYELAKTTNLTRTFNKLALA